MRSQKSYRRTYLIKIMDEQIQPQEQPMTSEPEFQPEQFPPISPSGGQPNKKLWIYVLVGLVIAGGAFGFWWWQTRGTPSIKDFESCFRYVHDHTDIAISHCQAPDGRVFENPSWHLWNETKDWQTYRNEEYGFEFRYPNKWQLEDTAQNYGNLKFIVEVINPSYPGKPDTDIPIEQFLVYISSSCKEEPWEIGFAELEYKRACIKNGNLYFQLDLNPVDPNSKTVMDQILSTFKFIE